MNSTQLIKLWKTKLRAAKADERHLAKVYNQIERAMRRTGREIDQLEKKIANKLAQTQS